MIYHGTPITPERALRSMVGRAFCVSFFYPQSDYVVSEISRDIMLDNGAFSFWKAALKSGRENDEVNRDWRAYYAWSEKRQRAGTWAVIPDAIGAPSQINDGLINDWPHGNAFGAPVWHMNGPLERLPRLASKFDRVCLGWVGGFENGKPLLSEKNVGCDAYKRRMDEVNAILGNQWPKLHMLRGVKEAFRYPFDSADSTSLGQNGWRHDWRDVMPWSGRAWYADRLEGKHNEQSPVRRKSKRNT